MRSAVPGLMALALMLTFALLPARAEECSAIADPAKNARCLARDFVRQSVCRDATDTQSEIDCTRAWETQQAITDLCGTDEAKLDKTACLELKVAALTRELFVLRQHMQYQMRALRTEMPRLVEEGMKAALEPRLHR